VTGGINSLTKLSLVFLSVTLVLNLLDMIVEQAGLIQYVVFVLPFVITIGSVLIFRGYKVNAFVYAIFGLLTTLGANTGNFSGAIFICFSLYIFNTKKTNVILIALLVVCIGANSTIRGFTVSDTLNNLNAYAFTVAVYYYLIHPRPAKIIESCKFDGENKEILEYLADGYSNKEIADKVYLTHNAVTKRLKTLRDNMGVRSNSQLVHVLTKKGYYKHN
jgi:DNA-binding CsgD family transcriptional regulator